MQFEGGRAAAVPFLSHLHPSNAIASSINKCRYRLMSAPQTRPRQLSNNQGQRPPAQAAPGQSHQSQAESDYVYFDRSTAGFTSEAIPKAKAAQLKLEHFYKLAVDAAVERNTRSVCSLL
jgi:hypothetical protein